MSDQKILFQISTGNLFADLKFNAGVGPRPNDDRIILHKAFEPEKDISAYELAQVYILFTNLSKAGQMLAQEDFDALAPEIARHFKDQ
jgi:hypothetical protein